MARWSGDDLKSKRAQALDVLRRAMEDMSNHEDWITLTEILWQAMSDKVNECQLDVLRNERFGSVQSRQSDGARARYARYEKYKRVLKALNFLLKCVDVDWNIFMQTVADLVEGRTDVKGLDSPTRRDQSDGSSAAPEKGADDSGAGD